ncbi:amino acid-binding protein [Pseudarthrobacter sp. NS4]|uniref:amino acid-binding protein n=1 Tax=Pseudarthrobacter sp. NS4 TaxID=2973976 RepID=UPI0021639083|nr:amino acid-binding protein [Pseudarthrobacter sp. NS4]
MLPIELAVHAAVMNTGMPYLHKVLVLTLTATVLVIWVAEPSVRRALRDWLHAPSLHRRRELHTVSALWRIRATTEDGPVAQWALRRALERAHVDVIDFQRHGHPGGVLVELVVAAPETLGQEDLLAAAGSGSGRNVLAWRTTALAVADGQTKALSLAVRVAGNPDELQLAVAELLGAEPVPHKDSRVPVAANILKIPSPGGAPLFYRRQDAPFTQAESARAHRLAELAELAASSPKTFAAFLTD